MLLVTEAGSIAHVTSIGHAPVYVADSVSFGERAAGAVLVTGSHGGISAGEYARRFGLLALVCNDAGFGKNNAGVAGLDALDADGIAGIGAGHETARIGEGGDVWRNGVVTFANHTAAKAGVRTGQTVQQAVRVLVEATC